MSMTFMWYYMYISGLKESTEDMIKEKQNKEDKTVWDQYLDKKKEKKKKKKKEKPAEEDEQVGVIVLFNILREKAW